VRLFNVALTAQKSQVQMEISDSNMGDSRIRVESGFASAQNQYGESGRRAILVPGERLDSLVDRAELGGQGPIFMKVDVQGAEVKVLRGAGDLLTLLDFLYLEYWPYGLRRAGDSPEELTGILEQFPYGTVFDDQAGVDPAMLRLLPLEEVLPSLDPLLGDGSSTGHADLLLARSPEMPSSDGRRTLASPVSPAR
jgi:FkbM family methyltransferase